jgi:steroid delta-isomerase-like uncharacterized protein
MPRVMASGRRMNAAQMDELVEAHLEAEMASDVDGATAMYTDDIEHDVVGAPTGGLKGKDAAKGFYEHLTQNVRTEAIEPTRRYYGEAFCVIEHDATGTVQGEFLGIPGNGKRITFRLLHVWEFRDGRISRENVWMDGGSVVAQLTGGDKR